MAKTCRVSINGSTFEAGVGERILDAALLSGLDVPYDCRSGQCGTCRMRVRQGQVLGGRISGSDGVLTCQGVVVTDLDLLLEDTPPIVELPGEIVDLSLLSRDVMQVTVETTEQPQHIAGQYYRCHFFGHPARALSPTISLEGQHLPRTVRFQVKRLIGGAVSSRLGHDIRQGHPVVLEGPFGSAYFRPRDPRRLLLFSGGTGFAPIWAIADAALSENVERAMVVVAGVRTLGELYMAPALQRLALCPAVAVVPMTEEPQDVAPAIRTGRPSDLASLITAGDVVHAAGSPAMVEAIRDAAEQAGAEFYADPFTPSGETARQAPSWRQWWARRNRRGPSGAAPLAVPTGG